MIELLILLLGSNNFYVREYITSILIHVNHCISIDAIYDLQYTTFNDDLEVQRRCKLIIDSFPDREYFYKENSILLHKYLYAVLKLMDYIYTANYTYEDLVWTLDSDFERSTDRFFRISSPNLFIAELISSKLRNQMRWVYRFKFLEFLVSTSVRKYYAFFYKL